MDESTIAFDDAAALTRTGDVWLFRGRSPADTLIRVATNAPVNHVGMAVVIDDLPPLLWHAELGQSLEDVWSGQHQRGVQLHNLHEAVRTWNDRYNQQAWIRQLHYDVTPQMEEALLQVIARLDGTPFPSTTSVARRWIKGRARSQASLETIYCAELVAATYSAMGILGDDRPENWYDPGRFWSGDSLELVDGARLGDEIAVEVPPLPGPEGQSEEQLEHRRRDAAREWWKQNGVRVQNERLGRRLRTLAEPPDWSASTMSRLRSSSETETP